MAPQRTNSDFATNIGALGFLASLAMAAVGLIGALVAAVSNNETGVMAGLGIALIAAALAMISTLAMISAMLLRDSTRGDK